MEKSKIVDGNKEIGEYTIHQMLRSERDWKVYKAIHKPTGKIYALKMIYKSRLERNPYLEAYFWVEKEIMELINHEHFVQLHKHIETDSKHYLVMDFCNKGDFQDYMDRNDIETIEESKAIEFIRQLAKAFKELRK